MGLLKEMFFHPNETISMFRFKFGGHMPSHNTSLVFPPNPTPPSFTQLSSSSSTTTSSPSSPPFDAPTLRHQRTALDAAARRLSPRAFCYALLNAVSRSFAIVIQQLPPALRDAVCVFYLVLRGLDTAEDDMQFCTDAKLALLVSFADRLHDTEFRVDGVGDSEEYRCLLRQFDKVVAMLHTLPLQQQQVIEDITRRMGKGMAEFVNKGINNMSTLTPPASPSASPSSTSSSSSSSSNAASATTTSAASASSTFVETHADYNLYCHYVAGLVGLGLSQLFESSGLCSYSLSPRQDMWNDMGVLLQKVNIIRDYAEDVSVSRCWWPREIWQRHADKLNGQLTDFAAAPSSPHSLACLDELVIDALTHIPNCLRYLSHLNEHEGIFRFCAIPQLMALCTLSEIFHNARVFTSVVKMRKGQTCDVLLHCQNMRDFTTRARKCINMIQATVKNMNRDNDEATQTLKQRATKICAEVLKLIEHHDVEYEQQVADEKSRKSILLKPTSAWKQWSTPTLSSLAVLLPIAYYLVQQPAIRSALDLIPHPA